MDALLRSLFLARFWTAGTTLAAAVVAVRLSPSWPAWLALAIATATGTAGLLATARFARAYRAGDVGEILMKAGPRVPYAAFTATHAADRAELVAAVLVLPLVAFGPALVGVEGSLITVLLGSVAAGLGALVWRQRRWSHALIEGLVAYQRHDLEAAERVLGPALGSPVPAFRDAATGLFRYVRLARGERDAVLRETEVAWAGTLDDEAALLGMLRAGVGDASLLERYVAACRAPATRYERYLAALARGHLHVHRGRWEDALAAAREPVDVPGWYQRQLRLLEVAALQGAGRTEEARTLLSSLAPGLDVEAWRQVAYPVLWGLLEDAGAGRATAAPRAPVPLAPPAIEVAQPFAAPATPPVARARWTRAVGAVPIEGLALGTARGPAHATLLAAVSLGVIALCAVLFVLVAFIQLLGGGDPVLVQLASFVGPVGLAIAALVLADVGLARHHLRDAPTVVLSDGRRVARRWWGAWTFAGILGLFGMGAMVFSVFALAEGIAADTPWTWVLGVPFGAVVAYAAFKKRAIARLVGAVHFLPPDEARRVAERSSAATGSGAAWLALARLWTGDAAGAEQAAHDAALVNPELGWIDGWLRAGRGEVDLERILAEAEPELLADRYRRAVLVAVAALHAGAAARVADRLDDWADVAEQLPNRYGALLERLVAGARRANGQSVADTATIEVAWVARVWPFVP